MDRYIGEDVMQIADQESYERWKDGYCRQVRRFAAAAQKRLARRNQRAASSAERILSPPGP